MSITRFLSFLFLLLAFLTGVAALWRPPGEPGNRVKLIWVSDNNPMRAAQIDAFNRENPELLLKLDYSNVGLQKILLQCGSGIGPDIFDYHDEQMQSLVEAGVLSDVTEAAAEQGFSADRCWPAGSAALTYQGRQYGFPCNIGANVLFYNRNVFDDFGVAYPKGLMTIPQFIELAMHFTPSIDEVGAPDLFAVHGLNWRILFEAQHGEFFTEEGRPHIAGNTQLRGALELHRDLIFKYRLMPSTVEVNSMSGQGGWGSGARNHFAAGRFAMLVSGQWALIGLRNAYQHQFGKELRPLRLGCVLLPRFEDKPACYRITSRLAGINAHGPHRDEALAFLKYLAGSTYSTLLNQGPDYLPGVPEYADGGFEKGPDDLAAGEVHERTKEAMSYGYVQRRSPYLLISDVAGLPSSVLDRQVSRLESNPRISIDDLLRTAQDELEVRLKRNLERNPELRKRYAEGLITVDR